MQSGRKADENDPFGVGKDKLEEIKEADSIDNIELDDAK